MGISSIYGASFERANQLYEQGFFIQAEEETVALLENAPNNLEYRKLLARIYISQGRFEDAKNSSLTVLYYDPQDIEFNLIMARIHSWMMEYDDSIGYYDKCLELEPADLTCWIEKARVLGWANRYKKSLAEYEAIYDAYKQEWIHYEMLGKKALWNHRIEKAIENFELSLNDKADNEEVLMHLGQIYSYSAMYDTAVPYYAKVKDVSPYNTSAQQSDDKNTIRRDDFHLRVGVNRWKADSDDRQTQVSNIVPFVSLSKYIAKYLMLTVGATRGFYTYSSSPDIKQTGASVNLDYAKGFYHGLGAGYEFTDFDKGDSHHNYNVYGWFRFLDRFIASMSYRQENVITNFNNIVSGLQTKYALARLVYDANKTFMFGADYMFGSYTDGNSFGVLGGDIQITYTQSPTRLYTIFRAENWNYSKASVNYFAPGTYNEYSGLIGFRHDIAKNGLYYGAKEIYYDIQMRFGLNSNEETSYSPRFMFHADFSNHVYIEGYASLYESVFYSDHTFGALLGFYF
jgi:tetratricopeptide (TPR) repeat protein